MACTAKRIKQLLSKNALSFQQVKCLTLKLQAYFSKSHYIPHSSYKRHCYKNLYPWKNNTQFAEDLISSIVYNKDGLIALNKPFGIKIHSHDRPGARSEPGKHKMVPYIPDSKYTVEDALPILKEYLNVPNLSILKSAEKYTSGIVLLSANDDIAKAVQKSFEHAKRQKKTHLTHWLLTLGYSVSNYRKEKVGIKFLDVKLGEPKQPVIALEFSKRAVKQRIVYPVNVEYRVLNINKVASSSLVEISTSAVTFHFVRVYASSRIAPILGDVLYGSRMSTVLGVPVRLQIKQMQGFDLQDLPKKMTELLNLPKGLQAHVSMPTMLHFRSVFLPSFKGEDDITITAPPPTHFQWTSEKLNLLSGCK